MAENTRESTAALLNSLRAAARAGRAPAPEVRMALAAVDDPLVARRAGGILAGLPAAADDLRPATVSVLATCTVGPFEAILRTCLVAAGVAPTIEAADYGSFELTLATGRFADDTTDFVAFLMDESYFLPADWSTADLAALEEHIERQAEQLCQLVTASVPRTSATFVLHTVPLPAQVRDTVTSVRARAGVARAWCRLNTALLGLAAEHPQIAVVDLVSALADSPYPARDDRLHRYADLPYTDGALLALATEVRRVVQARLGLSRKVLALDLDNTLWGGVLGEVGARGVQLGGLYPGNCYRHLQRTAQRLREQGVILVLASKNDPELVAQALTEHPEMLLRPEAFAVTAVNWSSKVANLRQAVESLDLSTQSVVFMDDSPFERGHVASELPDIALVAADGDPAYLVRSLLRPGWFDVMELTETDRQRPMLYRSRALRNDFSTGFGSSEEYLRALQIQVIAEPVTEYTVPRVAQLAARTNQFNLTGERFDHATTAAMSTDPDHLVAAFSVSDRFGDEGIVGALWARRSDPVWRVLNVVLSCRVLGRGVELAMVEWLVGQARAADVTAIEGRFVPSKKNGVASGFWERAGFSAAGQAGVFTLGLNGTPYRAPDWIRLREGSGV